MKSIGFLEELQREVVARHKTETRRLTDPQPDDYLLNPRGDFILPDGSRADLLARRRLPGTRSAKLSLSKSRTFRTLWVLIEYFTNTIRQTFKPCKNSDMENTLTNPDSGEISNPCRRGWPATSFG